MQTDRQPASQPGRQADRQTLHCLALHYITLHYITLHYIHTLINGIKVMVGVLPMFGRIQMFALFSGTVSLLAPFAQVSKEWILTHGIANLQVPFDMGSFRTLPLVIGGNMPGMYWRDAIGGQLWWSQDPGSFGSTLAEQKSWYRLWILRMGIVIWLWHDDEWWHYYQNFWHDFVLHWTSLNFRFSQLLLLLRFPFLLLRPVSTW